MVWVAGKHDPADPGEASVKSATAEVGDYRLLAVEMRHAFMLGMPLYMPQITWSIYEEDGDSSVGRPRQRLRMPRYELRWPCTSSFASVLTVSS